MSNVFNYDGYSILGGESNRSQKRCLSKRTCERVKEIYSGEILPVCPLVKEVVNKETFPNILNLPKSSSKYSRNKRILEVFRELIARQQPTKAFITWCAHRNDVLQDCMNLIEKDLKLLPKWCERDYQQTSQKLEKLIKRLHANVSMYHSAHFRCVFMLPPIPDELLKDYRNVLAWQEEKENPDESLCIFLTTGEISGMASLICHYPAAAIQTMNRISNELLSLAQIDIEKTKEEEVKLHNKALVELKQTRQASEKMGKAEQQEKDGQSQKPAETEQDIALSKLRKKIALLKNHPHIYGLTGGVIFLFLFLVVGLFKSQWRQWCWGVACLAFLVLVISLLGGRSR